MNDEHAVIHESSTLLVLNKPANLPVLRDRSGIEDLWTQLKKYGKYYLVHRLDKGTSGVLLIGKTQARQSVLTRAFNAHQVRKYYLARVVGQFPTNRTLLIDLHLRKGRKSRYRVAGQRADIQLQERGWRLTSGKADGLPAITRVRCLKVEGEHSWIVAQPLSGRTHQLRVHLSWIGHPIVGDHLYGKPDDPLQKAERLMLHCHRLVLPDGESYQATMDR